jgi:hypothetical protein
MFDFWKNLAENQQAEVGKTIQKLTLDPES